MVQVGSTGFQGWYDDFARLIQTKQLGRIRSLLTEDFVASPPSGEKGNRTQWLRQIGKEFKKYDYPSVSLKVGKIQEDGADRVVHVTHSLVTTSKQGLLFDSVIKSRQVLSPSGRGWRIRQIDTTDRKVTIRELPSKAKVTDVTGLLARRLSVKVRPLTIKELHASRSMMQGCGNP